MKTVRDLVNAFRVVDENLERSFFAVLGQLRGELALIRFWVGEIVGADDQDAVLRMFRDLTDRALNIVDFLLQIGSRAIWEANWAVVVGQVFVLLQELDSVFDERIVIRRDSYGRDWGVTYGVMAFALLRSAVRGESSVELDIYPFSGE